MPLNNVLWFRGYSTVLINLGITCPISMGLIQSYILKLIKRVPESSWDFIVESNLCRCSTFAHFQGDEPEKGPKNCFC